MASWAWEQLPGKGGPNGRSGHRMALHGSQLLIFGGFNDSGKSTMCGLPCVRSHALCVIRQPAGAGTSEVHHMQSPCWAPEPSLTAPCVHLKHALAEQCRLGMAAAV